MFGIGPLELLIVVVTLGVLGLAIGGIVLVVVLLLRKPPGPDD